jgi:hypothetical protein
MQCLRQKLSGGGVGVFLFWQGRVFRVCSHDQERVGGECTVWTPCGFSSLYHPCLVRAVICFLWIFLGITLRRRSFACGLYECVDVEARRA